MTGSPPFLSGEFPARYLFDRELGAGATANVFLASDSDGQGLVAIKILRQELAESLSVERFLREIRLTTRLDHPNIVPIRDSGIVGGRPYCVLAYMEGGTLRDRLERSKQLPLDEALTIAASIARALEFAHARRVIHRDVKPENILFGKGLACLADFGIARAIEGASTDHSTSTGIVRGTPAYMSPEQASGDREFDGRTDIYSLGCVLYEMVAGVPAFVGPTSQSVLAQRLTHVPQSVGVYRPTAPLVVQRIIQRTLATSPADRFQTASELADALESARSQLTEGALAVDVEFRPSRARTLAWRISAAVGVVAVATLAYAFVRPGAIGFRRSAPLDSTQVALFVIYGGPDVGTPSDELLRSGLGRWRGVSLVPREETLDAMRRRHVTSSSAPGVWRSVAAELRAGRYVVARLARTPTGRSITAEYRDASSGMLHGIELPLPADSNRVADAYRIVADSLMLRGGSDGADSSIAPRPRNLFATQAFIAGLDARSEWNLSRADSLFAKATEIDPAFTRAHLWLAQVRLWQGLPSARWASSVERAASDSSALTKIERTMSGALGALLRREYSRACERYRSLVAADSNSFIGWYGLGDCVARDYAVVRDAASPSGWRYRSSYYQAIKAYVRAFELLPATYHGFQAGGYVRLRELLYTSNRWLRNGTSLDSGGPAFVGRPRLMRDSIAMIPFEQARVMGSDPSAASSPGAIDSMRSIFRQVARRWASAFPRSADAKEAVAISLEIQADPAALDSMRVAGRLTTDPLQKLRYAAAAVLLQVKFAVPDGLAKLEAARREADSLIRAHPTPSATEAKILAPMAALAGHCTTTAALLRQLSANANVLQRDVPQAIAADAYALRAYVALGCAPPPGMPTVRQIASRIDESVVSPDVRQMVVYGLLAPATTLDSSADLDVLIRLAASGDDLFAAVASSRAGDSSKLRSVLSARAASRRTGIVGDFTPDAALPEARMLLALHDTAAAVHVLDAALSGARAYAPLSEDEAPYVVGFIGAFITAMELRAEIAGAADRADARRWSRAALAIWKNSEALAEPSRERKLSYLASR